MDLTIKNSALLLVVLSATLTACKKNEQPAPEAAAAPQRTASIEAEAAPAAPPPATPAPDAAAQAATPPPADVTDKMPTAPNDSSLTKGAVHEQLTLALHRYFENTSKMPQTFQDLVNAKYIDKMPTPPAGKTFAIDRRHLQVVIVPK